MKLCLLKILIFLIKLIFLYFLNFFGNVVEIVLIKNLIFYIFQIVLKTMLKLCLLKT
jgi:hypothetical protein